MLIPDLTVNVITQLESKVNFNHMFKIMVDSHVSDSHVKSCFIVNDFECSSGLTLQHFNSRNKSRANST